MPTFVETLAASLGLPADFVTEADEPDGRYDLLTLAMRAAGLHEDEAVYVFLTLNQGVARSAERVTALVAVFRSLGRAAARDLLATLLDRPLPSARPTSTGPITARKPRSGTAPSARRRCAQPRPCATASTAAARPFADRRRFTAPRHARRGCGRLR